MIRFVKIIGTGLATTGLIRVGVVFGVLLSVALFAFSEANGLFTLMMVILISFIWGFLLALGRKSFGLLQLLYSNLAIENLSSFRWRNLGLRLLVAVFFFAAYKYPYMFMSSQLGISKYWYIVYSVINFILLQYIFFELGLLKDKLTVFKLIILFLISLLSVAFIPIIFHALLFAYSDLFFEFINFLRGIHLISVAEAAWEEGESGNKGGSSSGNNQGSNSGNIRDNYRYRGESSNNNNPRRSASPVQRTVLGPETQFKDVQLPSLRSQVQIIAPLGEVAVQRSAISEVERITRDAMDGTKGYLPSNYLFDDENNCHAYNAAEAWYRGNLHEIGMFSSNQRTYVSRLVLEIEKSLVSTHGRESGLETGSAAHRLAAYHFKQNFEQNNNFQR